MGRKKQFPKGYMKNFHKLMVIGFGGPTKNGKGRLVKCECECGSIIEIEHGQVLRGKKKSCGCIQKQKELNDLGKKIERLEILERIIKIDKKNKKKVYFKCKCDCGNIIEIYSGSIYSGSTKSCGCLKQESFGHTKYINQKFNKLTVLGLSDDIIKRKKGYVKCECKCGKIIERLRQNVIKGQIYSCGCSDKSKKTKNGLYTSSQNIKLHEMFGGEHNHYTDVRYGKQNRRINVDLAFPDERIAIEFDCLRWHSSDETRLRDMEQSLALTKAGWKLLRIISKRDLPTKEQIDEKLEELRQGKNFTTIYVEEDKK